MTEECAGTGCGSEQKSSEQVAVTIAVYVYLKDRLDRVESGNEEGRTVVDEGSTESIGFYMIADC